MRIGRIRTPEGMTFAVAPDERSWVQVASLGIAVNDTRELITKWDEISRALDDENAASTREISEFASPVVHPGKIVAIGLNYMDHIRETGSDVPERVVAFAKYPSSLNGPYDDIVVDPSLTKKADYEAELAAIIGQPTRSVSAANALAHVFGYCVANDVSARDEQAADSQFSRSKSMDTFCPIGPWITTADEVREPQNLQIQSWVNGELRQSSNTREMIFSLAIIIEYLSKTMTLEPGDVILTGTPHGVGLGNRPPKFLKGGDLVRCQIEGLGFIENPIVSPVGSA